MRGAKYELKKVIVGCVGSKDLEIIQRMAPHRDVIAVIFDLGEGASPRELHDQARAAGARRCHVLDVRDDYVRACILPAADDAAVDDRAREFIAGKLADIAALEAPAEVIAATDPESRAARSRSGPVDCSATVAIAFENSVPVAINGITMTLSELVECLTTLGDVHGLTQRRPAVPILRAARRQLRRRASGVAHVELSVGSIRVSRPALATT
jgi:argininosuccinate synthase